MRYHNACLALTLVTCMIVGSPALALDRESLPAGFPAWDYYGWQDNHDGFLNVAQSQVQIGIQMYSRVYGRLPTSWAEVTGAGLWQVPLVGFNLELINPDDGRLDFAGDVAYQPFTNPPTIACLVLDGYNKPVPQSIEVGPTQSFKDYFDWVKTVYPDAPTDKILSDPKKLQQFAIIRGLKLTISTYRDIHGDYPKSYSELVSSGLGPISWTTINPVTDSHFKGDGSPGDLLYRYYPASEMKDGKSSFLLQHVESDGSTSRFGYSY